jgi:hypothetical protein
MHFHYAIQTRKNAESQPGDAVNALLCQVGIFSLFCQIQQEGDVHDEPGQQQGKTRRWRRGVKTSKGDAAECGDKKGDEVGGEETAAEKVAQTMHMYRRGGVDRGRRGGEGKKVVLDKRATSIPAITMAAVQASPSVHDTVSKDLECRSSLQL